MVVVLVAYAGCVKPNVTECDNGLICSPDRVCDELHRLCVQPDQLVVCRDMADAVPCTFGEVSSTGGFCRDGVCLQSICGDAVVTGAEECDGEVLPKTQCTQLGFYDEGKPLTCTAGCFYDRAECTGKCGDNNRDFANGEYCDGSLPNTFDSCVTFGFDAGVLACNNGFCIPGFSECEQLQWVQQAPDARPNAIWGAADNDVYAVGNDGLLAHFDGAAWLQVAGAPTVLDIRSVWGTASDDVYVAGGGMDGEGVAGFIFHFDGTQWTPMTLPANTPTLTGIWVGGGGGFAVGLNGTALRLVSGAWTAMTSPTSNSFRAVWASGPNNAFAGNNDGLYRFTGAGWVAQTLPVPGRINSLTGLPNGEVFAVGVASSLGIAAHFDGASWSAIDVPLCTADLLGVWAASATDVYATGFNGSSANSRTMFHYNGSSWTPITTPSPSKTTAVWGSSASSVWVGASTGIWHNEGAVFSLPTFYDYVEPPSGCGNILQPPCSTLPFSAIAGKSDHEVYAFGNVICSYDGENWRRSGASTARFSGAWISPTGIAFGAGTTDTVNSVFCNASGSYVVRTDAMVTWGTSSGTWVFDPPPNQSEHTAFNDVWGTSDSNVYVVGSTAADPCVAPAPLIRRYNGSSWSTITPPSGIQSISRIWGPSATEIYVMGTGGANVFQRYNGATWTVLPAPPVFCPVVMDMTGVGTEVLLTCLTDQHVYRFDGVAWQLHGSPHGAKFGARMRMVALSLDDVFVFGSNASAVGTISEYEAGQAYPVRYSGGPVLDAWGTPDRLFWVGSDGVHSLVRSVPW